VSLLRCISFLRSCLVCAYLMACFCLESSIDAVQCNRFRCFAKNSGNSSVSALMAYIDQHTYRPCFCNAKTADLSFILADLLVHELILTGSSVLASDQQLDSVDLQIIAGLRHAGFFVGG